MKLVCNVKRFIFKPLAFIAKTPLIEKYKGQKNAEK